MEGFSSIVAADPLVLCSDSISAAAAAGLTYVESWFRGIRRLSARDGFRYVLPSGKPLTRERDLERIRSLVIPPAWTDVQICLDANGHIQAVGRDAKGRKQYRYHPRWREVRDAAKYGRLLAFAGALPALRRRVARDLRRSGLPREKVLATVADLLERTLIRVGNEEYAQKNDSYGLTTLRERHVDIEGANIRFSFRGKSGKEHVIDVRDRRLAIIVRRCQELPGQELFHYLDDAGTPRRIESSDVNAYLREAAGDDFSAKDVRTWYGTLLLARALFHGEQAGLPTAKNVATAVKGVAARLGNTPAVCRRCYVHPAVISRYLRGEPAPTARAKKLTSGAEGARMGLSPEERALVALLRAEALFEKQDGGRIRPREAA